VLFKEETIDPLDNINQPLLVDGINGGSGSDSSALFGSNASINMALDASSGERRPPKAKGKDKDKQQQQAALVAVAVAPEEARVLANDRELLARVGVGGGSLFERASRSWQRGRMARAVVLFEAAGSELERLAKSYTHDSSSSGAHSSGGREGQATMDRPSHNLNNPNPGLHHQSTAGQFTDFGSAGSSAGSSEASGGLAAKYRQKAYGEGEGAGDSSEVSSCNVGAGRRMATGLYRISCGGDSLDDGGDDEEDSAASLADSMGLPGRKSRRGGSRDSSDLLVMLANQRGPEVAAVAAAEHARRQDESGPLDVAQLMLLGQLGRDAATHTRGSGASLASGSGLGLDAAVANTVTDRSTFNARSMYNSEASDAHDDDSFGGRNSSGGGGSVLDLAPGVEKWSFRLRLLLLS
jgi:hypothetical protein